MVMGSFWSHQLSTSFVHAHNRCRVRENLIYGADHLTLLASVALAGYPIGKMSKSRKRIEICHAIHFFCYVFLSATRVALLGLAYSMGLSALIPDYARVAVRTSMP